MDLVSIIVPIYNMENFLERCIQRLINQDYPDIQIILVDDGSTDRSPQICDEFERNYSEKITVIHKKNGGLSSARNKGMEQALGKFIVFPDPDDWVELNYVSKAMEFQKKYSVDMVGVGYFIEYDNYSIPANQFAKACKLSSNQAKDALLLSPSLLGFAWNKFYRKDIIDKNNLKFLDDVGTTEDLDFAFRYLNFCENVYFDPQTRVYHYYQHRGAVTNSGFSLKKVDSIHTYEKIINEKDSSKSLKKAAQCEICNTAINLILMYYNDEYNNHQVLIRIKKYLKDNLIIFLLSKHSFNRKIQGLIVYFFPKTLLILKKMKNKRYGGQEC